jgi:trehalose-phosphatase
MFASMGYYSVRRPGERKRLVARIAGHTQQESLVELPTQGFTEAADSPSGEADGGQQEEAADRERSRRCGVISQSISQALDRICSTRRLAVVCDYDGTLAGLVNDPAQAAPDEGALRALERLDRSRYTMTCVLSGRAYVDLNKFLRGAAPRMRIGSHGIEWGYPGVTLTHQQQAVHGQLARAISSLVGETTGLRCEVKPAGIAIHTRSVSPRVASLTLRAASETFGSLPGVSVRYGSEVAEFMVVPANKGDAIRRLRREWPATAMLFIGDDLTDEDAFRALETQDVGIKVGRGITHAQYRVEGTTCVANILERAAELRAAWESSEDPCAD